MVDNNISITSKIITQLIGATVFVLIPIAITLMAPFTDLKFQKRDGVVTVNIKRYVLMFIPWQTKEVSNVQSVTADINSAIRYQDTAENRRKGRKGISLATAQLVIAGKDPEVHVQVDPELAREVTAQYQQFATSESLDPLVFSLYASWGLSYILGGVASFFAAFYLLASLAAMIICPFKLLKRKSVA